MSLNTLLILPSVLKDRTQMHTNTDDKLIYPTIKVVQDMYIMPLLGTALFNKIQSEIEADTLAGNYKDLMDDFLIDCICWLTISELPDTINFQFWNGGVGSIQPEEVTNAELGTLYNLKNKYKNYAEHYMKRARLYLLENASTLFPEYRNNPTGIDSVLPDQTSYTNPIYLGNEVDYYTDTYSLRHKNNQTNIPNDAGDFRYKTS